MLIFVGVGSGSLLHELVNHLLVVAPHSRHLQKQSKFSNSPMSTKLLNTLRVRWLRWDTVPSTEPMKTAETWSRWWHWRASAHEHTELPLALLSFHWRSWNRPWQRWRWKFQRVVAAKSARKGARLG
jgi:hypothetical protein